MIKRRHMIKTAAAVALSAPFVSSNAQQTFTLKFQTFVPASSNIWMRVITPWMKKVETESGGRIKFESYTSMQLGGAPTQLLEQVRDGVVDIAWTLAGYSPGRFPRSEVFELPFFTYDGEGASRAAWEFMTTYAPDELKDVRYLAFHTNGLNILHTKKAVVKSVADLKGMKVRGPSRKSTQMLSSLGAVPVGMPLPQIADALSKGVIEGAIIPWDTAPSAKLDELTTFHTEFAKGAPGFNNNIQFLIMNNEAYQKLPADLQAVINRNSGLELSAYFGRGISDYDPVVRKSVIDNGHTVHVVGKAQTDEFIRMSAPVTDDWVKDMNSKGFDGKKLLDAAKALIQKHRPKS